jgi:hypothetical protein
MAVAALKQKPILKTSTLPCTSLARSDGALKLRPRKKHASCDIGDV